MEMDFEKNGMNAPSFPSLTLEPDLTEDSTVRPHLPRRQTEKPLCRSAAVWSSASARRSNRW